ncbi:hypothetical protein BDV24DRAFT_141511 [Aspergillus arachidicola]|uniref:Uncharacterized protein n=1 Tax=Aspergillus arachidicola TaxID=656916 RepID=A0A5N6XTV4_9EURO|nr:hypothetical protein BDV24DRAFT_141511 [Aspergillus arachidicola]
MGSAIAQVFVDKGWKTTVWNRTAAKAQPLADGGAVIARSAQECIAASHLVITCVLAPTAFRDIMGSVDAQACSGRVLVDFTSGRPKDISQCAELAKKMSFGTYFRGSVTTTPQHVGLPETRLFYSGGDGRTFQSVLSALDHLGRSTYLGTDAASASQLEEAVASCFYGFCAGFMHSMAMLKTSQIYAPGGAERYVSEAVAPMCTGLFPSFGAELAKQVDSGDYQTKGGGVRVDTLVHGLENLIQSSTDQGLSPILLGSILKVLRVRVEQGGAAEEISGLVETLLDPNRLSE